MFIFLNRLGIVKHIRGLWSADNESANGVHPHSIPIRSKTDNSAETDYSSPQAARVLMVAFWLSPYTTGALEESSLPEHRHFAPKTIRGTAVLADAFHVSFNMRKA